MNIRRQGGRRPAANGNLAHAAHAKTTRECLIGFDPDFELDGRDDGVVSEVVMGKQMVFVNSPRAGQYWHEFRPVDGGRVQVVIRGLPRSFKAEKRKVFRGLTRIVRKNDARNGETIVVTIDVSKEGLELTHELKIFHRTPETMPANLIAVNTHGGAVALLELSPQAEAEAA